MAAIDLNSDLGESYGAWRMGDDEAMLAIVSSANIACGFHAGDPAGIYRTVKAAAEKAWSSAPMFPTRTASALAAAIWMRPPKS